MPRSPSRDLSDRYIGRRGYFKNPDAIRRGKYVLASLALLASLGWAVVDVAGPPRTAYGHSHGPLTNPHAAFDDNCHACHATFGLKNFNVLNTLDARERWHDLTCEKCHGGPPHHESATKEGADRHKVCSNCHHDHQGRTFSLVRLEDRDCNVCHMELDKWHIPAKSKSGEDGGPYAKKVTHFVTDHPKFRSLEGTEGPEKGPPKHKPRTLVFSHTVHMNPGQAYSADGKEAMTVAGLRRLAGPDKADAVVAKYAGKDAPADKKIQLTCASCHVLDAGQGDTTFDDRKAVLAGGDPNRSLLPPRAEGAYFLPTNFESHCRACHPLNAPEGPFPQDGKNLALPRFDLPHRKQPAELRALLQAGYVKALIADGKEIKDDKIEVPPPPGPGQTRESAPATKAFRDEVVKLTQYAENYLLANADGGCRKCHTAEPNKAGGLTIPPVPDRTVWLTHAKFNHASHRGATCAACHPGPGDPPPPGQYREAVAISPPEANKPEPVQILGLESCRTCHSKTNATVKVIDPKTKDEVTRPGGGIRHNCTDCHRYHHGDQPLQGRGADSWFPQKPRDIASWLKGD
jgi:hypothetical protein